MKTAVRFEQVSFGYSDAEVLRQVDLDIPCGKVSVLFGVSGAGKTTCLRLIAGLERPGQGTIIINDKVVSSQEAHVSPSQRKIGYCYQEPALWSNVRVEDHIRITAQQRESTDKETVSFTDSIIEEYNLTHLKKRYPQQLSGGEKKRLDFARAAASQPTLLLLDEPLSSVETPLRDDLTKTIQQVTAGGGTVIAVTHQTGEMYQLADQLFILNEGSIVQSGKPQDVFHHPKNKKIAEILGFKNFFSCEINSGVLISNLGTCNCVDTPGGKWLAACMPDDIGIEPRADGTGTVLWSHPFERYYYVYFNLVGKTYCAISPTRVTAGERISPSLKQKPVLIGLENDE